MGPSSPHGTVLTLAEETMVVEFRRRTLLPLDDVLGCLRGSIPKLTRLAAEFLAEAGDTSRFRSAAALASAAGLAPVLRQSGKVRHLQRPGYANNRLNRVFYQSAFCSLADPLSRAFYARKRKKGKRHHQAVVALARRRIDVLWALLTTRQPFSAEHQKAA